MFITGLNDTGKKFIAKTKKCRFGMKQFWRPQWPLIRVCEVPLHLIMAVPMTILAAVAGFDGWR
jgi:hypothetical protein